MILHMMEVVVSLRYLWADWIVVCDDGLNIIKDGFIIFNKTIVAVGKKQDTDRLYPDQKFEYMGINSVLIPGLINSHTHLEFGANTNTLIYGDFIKWLCSVLIHRDSLLQKADKSLIDRQLNDMLSSGTTSVGAVSSYGLDTVSLSNSPINSVCFVEVIGSSIDQVEENFANFQAKIQQIIELPNITPAVAVHSPYATHPLLIKKVLSFAREKNLSVQTHFMESIHEKRWLKSGLGDMKEFFAKFLGQTQPVSKAKKFLNSFDDIACISYTHCCYAGKKQKETIASQNGTIIHCAKSNRFLGSKTFDIDSFKDIAIGTDGLSSNDTLDMFDELKAALFLHPYIEINHLAFRLLYMATKGGAVSLGLNTGELVVGKTADIVSLTLIDKPTPENLALSVLLDKKDINQVFIQGKLCYS